MRLLITLTLFILIITACKNSKPDDRLHPLAGVKVAWADSLMIKYIDYRHKLLSWKYEKLDQIQTTWAITDLLRTDTATYYVYGFRNSLEDKDAADNIYADSASHHLYEHFIAANALVKWP